MSNDSDPLTACRTLGAAVIEFATAFGLHGIDHLRRGMAASPQTIMVGGMIQGFFVVMAVMLVLRHHKWASEAAMAVGFGSAVLFVYAHLLPTFLPGYQDSFTWDRASMSHCSLGSRPSLRSGLDWSSATWVCKHGGVSRLGIYRT